jgi:replicative DNA helicase
MRKAARLVISYSHRDELFRDEITSALSPAIRAGEVDIWSDHRIIAGQNIDDEIMAQLKEADAVLLLVSADFIASDYCFKTELEIALDRHKNGRSVVIPIVIRPTDFSGMIFSRLKMLPADAKAVTTWDNRDEAWLSVVHGVRTAIQGISTEVEKQSVFRSRNIKECLAESFDELQERYVNQDSFEKAGTGFSQLNNLLVSLSAGDLIVLAGRPGSGFVELAVALTEYAAIKHRQKIRIVSQRLSAQKYANRLLCSTGLITLTDLRTGQLEDEDWSRVATSIRMLKETDITIDDEAIRSLKDLDRKLDQITEDGCDLLVVDGLEYLSNGSHQDEKAIAFRMRDFARSKKSCVLTTLALGHRIDERVIKRPVLGDLAQWEELEHSSDRILFVSRPELYELNGRDYGQVSPFTVEVVKNTDGFVGDVVLRLHTHSGAVSESDKGESAR